MEAAYAAGLVGRRRVLDSTPLYDVVATMDTVTLIRSVLRGLLVVAEGDLAVELRAVLSSGDDYVLTGKPQIDWDDRAARAALVDALARDARALLTALDGGELGPEVLQAAVLLATVVGQDLEQDAEGVFGDRAARGPRPGRIHGGSRRPAWTQDLGAWFRRLQGPCRHRPGQRDHHRHHRHRR